jgi:UPF0176 protein
MRLHNIIDGKILKEKMRQDARPRRTISFYKYHQIADPAAFRNELFLSWSPLDVLGRVYVAHEGINAQVSVPEERIEDFRTLLYSIPFLDNIRLNLAVDDNGKSFFKLKIQVRKKLVADGIVKEDFDVTQSGQHVNAAEFNQLADQPGTIIVDMRNHYESEVGHFKNAIRPDADTFRDELKLVDNLLSDKKEDNIIMYCTGGIRCEKASAWLKYKGFTNVFQLDGGIIEYAKQVKEQSLENKFVGKNFVFDERLGERISNEVVSHCHQCGKPCDAHRNCRNDGCHLLFIQCEECAEKFQGCCSVECKEILTLPQDEQKAIRKGINKGRQVFKKGRFAAAMTARGMSCLSAGNETGKMHNHPDFNNS